MSKRQRLFSENVLIVQLKQRKWKGLVYLEGSGVYGTGAEPVVVQEQVLEVPDRGESVSGDAVNGVLFQMKQHQTARQTLGDCTQVVI